MSSARFTGLALAAIIGLGLLLRLPSPYLYLEYDEVISILFARQSLGAMVQATAADTMPPLYYGLLHGWLQLLAPMVTAERELLLARSLSLLCSVLAIPVFYLLARRVADTVDALAATALLALSPFHAFYGHFTRMYALLELVGLLAALCFVRWLQENRRRDLLLFTVAAAVSFYVHSLAFLLVFSLDILFLLGRAHWPGTFRPRLWELAAAHVALLVAFAPWLFYLPGQIEQVARAFWIPPPGMVELVRTTIVFNFHLPLTEQFVPLGGFLGLMLMVITAIETGRRWVSHRPARAALLIAGALAVLPVASLFLVSQLLPIYVERALLVSGAAYLLLLAMALRRLPLRPLAWAFSGVVVLGMVVAHSYQYRYQEFPRSPYYQASAYLAGAVQPGDAVLHDVKLSYFPMWYVDPNLAQGYLPDPLGSPNDTLAPATIGVLGLPPTTLEAAAMHRRVWLVLYQRTLDEAAKAGTVPASKAWLEQHYQGGLEQRIGDLRLYLYRTGV